MRNRRSPGRGSRTDATYQPGPAPGRRTRVQSRYGASGPAGGQPAAAALPPRALAKAQRLNPRYYRELGYDASRFGGDVGSAAFAQAVAGYQRANGLGVDGIAGPNTADHLQANTLEPGVLGPDDLMEPGVLGPQDELESGVLGPRDELEPGVLGADDLMEPDFGPRSERPRSRDIMSDIDAPAADSLIESRATIDADQLEEGVLGPQDELEHGVLGPQDELESGVLGPQDELEHGVLGADDLMEPDFGAREERPRSAAGRSIMSDIDAPAADSLIESRATIDTTRRRR